MSDDTGSVPEESSDSEAPSLPLEVKITNPTKIKPDFYESKDDIEYEEIILSDEDKDI